MYITQGLHRSVQQNRDGVAAVCDGRTTSFGQLVDRVGHIAGGLRELGVTSGDRVGYLGLNSDRFHEAYFAVPWADAVIVPLNTRWTIAEVAYAINDSEAAVLVVDSAFVDVGRAVLEQCDVLTTLVFAGDGPTPDGMVSWEALAADGPAIPDARRGGDALAGLFYTGGTTGFPKGVMLTHEALLTCALGSAAGGFLGAGSTFLHVAPMFHLADFAAWNLTTLMGRTHVMVPRFEPRLVLETIRDQGVTDIVVVPAMLQMLVDSPEAGEIPTPSLDRIAYGGSPITEAVLARAAERWPTVTFCQAYGQTEVAPIATLLVAADHGQEAQARGLLRSAGRAAPHCEVQIVDPERRVLPPGEVGEILVRGANAMIGYWDKPEETASALVDGWVHTGDGGYLDDDGYLFVVDRLKDMIITGGENVYCAEVENALATHEAVASCAVVGVPDDQWGERVHAVVVLAAGASLTAEELRDHARDLIAGYKLPRTVDFVEALPITSTGKVLKRTLREQYATAGQGVEP